MVKHSDSKRLIRSPSMKSQRCRTASRGEGHTVTRGESSEESKKAQRDKKGHKRNIKGTLHKLNRKYKNNGLSFLFEMFHFKRTPKLKNDNWRSTIKKAVTDSAELFYQILCLFVAFKVFSNRRKHPYKFL